MLYFYPTSNHIVLISTFLVEILYKPQRIITERQQHATIKILQNHKRQGGSYLFLPQGTMLNEFEKLVDNPPILISRKADPSSF